MNESRKKLAIKLLAVQYEAALGKKLLYEGYPDLSLMPEEEKIAWQELFRDYSNFIDVFLQFILESKGTLFDLGLASARCDIDKTIAAIEHGPIKRGEAMIKKLIEIFKKD